MALADIVGIIREMLAVIIRNTFDTASFVINSVIKIYLTLAGEAKTSGPLVLIITILLLSLFLYMIYKFLWSSAKTIAVFLFILIILFFITIFLI